jgi:hypothetical protein
MKKTFEDIIEENSNLCNWNEDTKYTLLLEFLECHCKDKIEIFENCISSIATDETST